MLEHLLYLTWLIPFAPFLVFGFIYLMAALGWNLGQAAGHLSLIGVGISALLSVVIFADVSSGVALGPIEVVWVSFPSSGGPPLQYTMGLQFDHLSALVGMVVGILSFLITLYSLGYMRGDVGLHRYYAHISLFIGAMLGLVYSNNYLMMFIMWELMGLCSYLLIGHYNHKPEAAAAAKKAFLVTRIGDVSFLIGLVVIWNTFGTFQFSAIEQAVGGIKDTMLLAHIALLLFGGAVGKSAQFPLHVWLPDAMEGPTPVSALIHAATMVKAGVFLVARSYPLFVHADPIALTTVAWVGGFTAIFAASMALVFFDIKRVLAYSTLSQLGYMFLALGVGGYSAGIFHLMNHAFFKALLFMGAGACIHAVHSNDMRQMGGLFKKMRWTGLAMLIATLSISGLPLLSGWWSKDEILTDVLLSGVWHADILYFFGLFTAVLTAFYMFRLWFLTFWGTPSHHAEHAVEAPPTMVVPVVLLAIPAALSGLLAVYVLDLPDFLEASEGMAGELFFQLGAFGLGSVSLELAGQALGSVMALLGLYIAWVMYGRRYGKRNVEYLKDLGWAGVLYRTLWNRYYIDQLYVGFCTMVIVPFVRLQARFDQGGIDGLVNGIASAAFALGASLRRLQTGIVSHYAAMIVLGIVLIAVVGNAQTLAGFLDELARQNFGYGG